MAAFTFDQSLGREVELYGRVDGNDPTNSALIMVVLKDPVESDNTLRQYATLSAVTASNPEVTNTGYSRKTLTDADLTAYSVNNSNHSITLVLPLQTFTTISAGNAWRKVLICYDSDTTSGTDANIVPVTAHDLLISGSAIVPNGSNIVIDFSAGFVIAT